MLLSNIIHGPVEPTYRVFLHFDSIDQKTVKQVNIIFNPLKIIVEDVGYSNTMDFYGNVSKLYCFCVCVCKNWVWAPMRRRNICIPHPQEQFLTICKMGGETLSLYSTRM